MTRTRRPWYAHCTLALLYVVISCIGMLLAAPACAEPYLAVQQGFKCASCHVSPTGGGMRNAAGNVFAQNVLPARTLDTGGDPWTGSVNRFIQLGGNVRATWSASDIPNQPQTNEFDLWEARAYLNIEAIPGRLSLYVDQLLGPGDATNLEAYARYWSADRSWFIRAGRMYLPFGLRLEDDGAFVRTVTGINMFTPDTGVEVGWEASTWSAQLAVSNGSADESESGKQVTGQVAYIDPRWRLGFASSFNDADAGDRSAYGVFGGLRTGPVAWLAEVDLVEDDSFAEGTRDLVTALLEANWAVRRGHNLKLTAEWFEPDSGVDDDEQTRWSAVYEYSPVQFLQVRGGARVYDGIPQNDIENRKFYFLELHGFF